MSPSSHRVTRQSLGDACTCSGLCYRRRILSFLVDFQLLSSVQFSSAAQSCPTLWPHESQHARPPCPSPTPRVHSDSCPLSRWYHPAISSSVVPFFSYPQSLPASETFPVSQLIVAKVAQSCPALCDPLDCSTPDFPVLNCSQILLKFMSFELVMPSNHLILCHSLLFPSSIFSSIRVFSNESALHIRWSKYWSFSFSISPSNEYSGLICFRMDWLDLLAVQGTPNSLLQHQLKSINSSVLSFLHSPTLTSIHDYWKNHSFDYMDFCRQSNVSSF